MNFDNTLFRASGVGNLMTSPVKKAEKEAGSLSEGAKTHLIDVFISSKYGRQTDINNRYVSKGLMVEEDGITLYSLIKKQFFKKNENHLQNDFIKGTPDLFIGDSIEHADIIIDIKCSWDIFTFFRVHTKNVNNLYYWQLQAYMALTGATSAKLAYCLIDTPTTLIDDEKRKLMWKMNAGTTENLDYINACKEIDLAMTYSDILINEKLIEFTIERDQVAIDSIYKKITEARAYLNFLESELTTPLLLAEYAENLNATIFSKA